MLRNRDVFRNWPLAPGPQQHHPRYQWRVATNLYASPHDLGDPVPAEVSSAVSRTVTVLAATGETVRFLHSAAEAALALGLREEDWLDYRRAVLREHGPWVDVETVAVRCCGYPALPPADGDDRIAAWRRPIRSAEATLRDRVPRVALPVIERWLATQCGCGPEYVGIRYPPAFTSTIADVFAAHYLALADPPPIDRAIAAAGAAAGGPHPHQVYGVWLRYGFTEMPSAERLARGFDTTDHLALERAGGCLTDGFLDRFTPANAAIVEDSKSKKEP